MASSPDTNDQGIPLTIKVRKPTEEEKDFRRLGRPHSVNLDEFVGFLHAHAFDGLMQAIADATASGTPLSMIKEFIGRLEVEEGWHGRP